jgi:AAA+ ATPase superfamily predicted ATPase
MEFYDREDELGALARIRNQSRKSSCFTVLIGRRRIGKTALLMESIKKQRYLYLFVSRKNETILCAQFQEEASKVLGLHIYGYIRGFNELFEQLLLFAERVPYTLIIDEFQDFDRVNPAIFSDIQNLWDQYKDKVHINFIACGSI